MIDTAMDFGKIIIADLILSGDNALVIGMAAVSVLVVGWRYRRLT